VTKVNAVKLSYAITARGVRLRLAGELESRRCACLEHFWQRRTAGPFGEVEVDLHAVEGLDGPAVATLVNLIRASLAGGARVILEAPPQMLAHTLYKCGLLSAEHGVTIRAPRTEEPYAG
jgi:ABC-type transporter Mla MlaB component